MKKTFRGPDGKETELADLDYIEELILKPKDTYWLSGSGDFAVFRYDTEIAFLILVYCKEASGFFVQFYPKKAPDDWLVAQTSAVSEKKLSISFGGNTYLIPANLIIPLDDTWNIVKQFLDSGKLSENISWVSYWDIDWPEIE